MLVFLNILLAAGVVAGMVTLISYAISSERKHHITRQRRVDPQGNVFGR
jgi:hypothetical protein